MAGIAYWILQQLIIASQGTVSILKEAIGADWKGKLSPVVCTPIAILWRPWRRGSRRALYMLVALMWLIPDRRIERALSRHGALDRDGARGRRVKRCGSQPGRKTASTRETITNNRGTLSVVKGSDARRPGNYIAHAGFFLSFVIGRRIAAPAPRDQGDGRVVSSQEPLLRLRGSCSSPTSAPSSCSTSESPPPCSVRRRARFLRRLWSPAPHRHRRGAVLLDVAVLPLMGFRAAVGVGHELETGGPFRILRHPIYLSLTLLALGTALWHPTPFIWVSFVILALLSDLRARAEETLLLRVYGETYAKYCERTRRFIPAIY